MGLVAEDGIADIVVMRGLDIVEEDNVLELAGVSHHGVFADNGTAADKGTVADFGTVVDDAGRTDPGRGKDFGILCDPDTL